MAYRDTAYNLKYTYFTTSWQAPETVAADSRRGTAIELFANGDVLMLYEGPSQAFMMARGKPGNWAINQIDRDIATDLYGDALKVVRRDDTLHVAYMEIYEKNVKYAAIRQGGENTVQIPSGHLSAISGTGLGVDENDDFHLINDYLWVNNVYHTRKVGPTWTTSSIAYGRYPSFRFDKSIGHLAYSDGGGIRYKSLNGGVWSAPEDVGNAAWRSTNLAVSPSGEPGVVFDAGNYPAYTVTYSYRSEGVWSAEPVTGGNYNYDSSLTYDQTGAPVVAVNRSVGGWLQALDVWRKEGSNWTQSTGFAPPFTTSGGASAMFFDTDGHMHIAFLDSATIDLWYGSNRSGVWAYQLVDAEGDAGYKPQIFVDPNGYVHIVYQGGGNSFKYATNIGGWKSFMIKNLGYNGVFGAAAMDPQGALHTWHGFSSNIVLRPSTVGVLPASSFRRVASW